MEGRLFTLVDVSDESRIFAWGMEITDEVRTEAVVYRRDPMSGKYALGLYSSAESACRRFSKIAPMAVTWEDTEWRELLDSVAAMDDACD